VGEIKSALELALEKAERLGRATPEEMAASQYQERGRQLAVHYLKEGGDLEAELRALPAAAQAAARAAVKEVFLRNISLPREGEIDPRQLRALDGLLLLASNKKGMARMKGELEQLLQNFLMVRNNAHQQLKARLGASLGSVQRALEAQYGQKVRVEVEQLPQFQEEWRNFQMNLIDQFEPLLEDCKAKMAQL
jgi:hypothetical protein